VVGKPFISRVSCECHEVSSRLLIYMDSLAAAMSRAHLSHPAADNDYCTAMSSAITRLGEAYEENRSLLHMMKPRLCLSG